MNLLQMSAAGAVMIAAVTVIRALVLHRVPKTTFLVLWGLVLARLLIPFSLPSGLSIYTLLKRSTPSPSTAAPAAAHSPIPAGHIAAVPQAASPSAAAVSGWAVLWAVGFLLCTVFFAAAYWKCCREFRMSLPVDNAFARQWLLDHPLRRPVSIRQSDRISSPLTFGVFRPVILMPKKTDWENETVLHYVLEHEFVHIQRFDTVSKLLLIAAVCVHWFNPLVWVMYTLANRDLELSCDETVIRRFGRSTRASYARVLIYMEESRSTPAPLCSHFSQNAIEERITAIMKTQKLTFTSILLAAALVTGTATAFATSAPSDSTSRQPAIAASETAGAVEPDEAYLAAGLTFENSTYFYQGSPVAGIYDDNGGIFTDGSVTDGIYLNIARDDQSSITGVSVITEKQFRELVDRHMNLNPPESALDEESIMSYVNPDDGKTYYSFDDGKTFEPLTDAEFEALYPTQDIEWWTYDEYKAWLDNEKVTLQSMLGEKGWTSGSGAFVWTQEKIDETIAMYEATLEEIKNGVLYSKTVDGQDDLLISYNPTDRALGTSTDAIELYIRLDNGVEKTFGPYETNAELLAEVRPFCEEQVRLGNMAQSEADEILSRYSAG